MISIDRLSPVLKDMGAEEITAGFYIVDKYVNIVLNKKTVVCKFMPPRGQCWISEKDYADETCEDTIKNYFFVGRYLCISKSLYYSLPYFMHKKYIDRNLDLLKSAFYEMEDCSARRAYEAFLCEWTYYNQKNDTNKD